jgi:hypothetical protein
MTTPIRYVTLFASLIFFSVLLFRMDYLAVRKTSFDFKVLDNDAAEDVQAKEDTNENNTTSPIIKELPKSDQGPKDKSPPPPPPRRDYPRATNLTKTATIVIQLSGELANNLQHMAHGIGLQQWALEKYGVDCNIVLRHDVGANTRAPKPKWKTARHEIQQCFPKLAEWDFTLGNKKELFTRRQRLQQQWLGKERSDYVTGLVNSYHVTDIERGLEFLATEILTDPDRPLVEDAASPIRLPYLFSESLDAFPMMDKYYSQIKRIMEFNDTACCAQIPSPQDTVFHYRNYISEMPHRRAYEMGFQELSPNQTAQEVFKGLPRGSPVRITTRIYNQKARDYALALNETGMNASLVTDQTGVQDFCFLKNTQKELVGSARSTYVLWAALLGNVSRVRLYHVDNWGLRQHHPNYWERFTYNWTNLELKRRIHFELYNSEEMKESF